MELSHARKVSSAVVLMGAIGLAGCSSLPERPAGTEAVVGTTKSAHGDTPSLLSDAHKGNIVLGLGEVNRILNLCLGWEDREPGFLANLSFDRRCEVIYKLRTATDPIRDLVENGRGARIFDQSQLKTLGALLDSTDDFLGNLGNYRKIHAPADGAGRSQAYLHGMRSRGVLLPSAGIFGVVQFPSVPNSVDPGQSCDRSFDIAFGIRANPEPQPVLADAHPTSKELVQRKPITPEMRRAAAVEASGQAARETRSDSVRAATTPAVTARTEPPNSDGFKDALKTGLKAYSTIQLAIETVEVAEGLSAAATAGEVIAVASEVGFWETLAEWALIIFGI